MPGNMACGHVSMVWICDPNYHKILPTLALNFSKNY